MSLENLIARLYLKQKKYQYVNNCEPDLHRILTALPEDDRNM